MTTRPEHRPVGFFALRSPVLAVDEVVDLDPVGAPDLRARLPRLLKAPEVREAVFLASPQLEAALDGWLAAADEDRSEPTNPDDLTLALARYVTRMATRPTPFGLFAAHATGLVAGRDDLARPTRLELPGLGQYRRHSRPDSHLLHTVMADATRGGLAAEQAVIMNQSAYRVEGRLRFVEAGTVGEQYRHTLASVAIDDRLAAVLECLESASAHGHGHGEVTAEALWAAVAGATDLEAEEAEAYVDVLAEAQIVVPTAGVRITGPEPLGPLLDACERASGAASLASRLRTLRDDLADLDRDGIGGQPDRYRAVAAAFGSVGEGDEPVDVARLCQVDLAAPGDDLELSHQVARRLADAAAVAWRLRRPRRHPDLDRFRDELRARHEHEWVSVVEITDPDVGIGFGGARSHEPLLRDLPFPVPESVGTWTAADGHLLGLLTAALDQQATEIDLGAADLDRLAVNQGALPDTFAVWATLVAPDAAALDRGDGDIVMTNVSGPSGAELLGRFAHGDAALEQWLRRLTTAEEELDPDAIYAELVHLPDPRSANVVLRPVLREWELPYLGLSGAPSHRQLRADDLEVAVRGDGIVLRSRSRGRRVVPRLASAHNHSTFGAPLYRLLGALATDDRDGAWTWGPLEAAPYLPRVRSGSVVLARARWRIDADEVGGTKQVGSADLDALRQLRRLPRWVVQTEGDNRLLLDLDDPIGVANLRRRLRAAGTVRLEEHFPTPDLMPVTREGRALAHEIVVPFITTRTDTEGADGDGTDANGRRARPATPAPEVSVSGLADDRPVTGAGVTRLHLPGSEWLYVKLYSGPRVGDRLVGELAALAGSFIAAGQAERWFFIRYADPDEHLRLRIGGRPDDLLVHVLPALTGWAEARRAEGRITRLVIDSYDRETDRYGGPAGIEPAETIFEHDSRAVSDLLAHPAARDMGHRWLLTLLGLRDLLVDLGFDGPERLRIAERCRRSFADEFAADRPLTTAIGAHFRTHRAGIDRLLGGDAAGPAEAHALEVFADRRARMAPASAALQALETNGHLSEPRLDLAYSFLHMHANRMLATRARAQELVLYDHLERVERSSAARNRPDGD